MKSEKNKKMINQRLYEGYTHHVNLESVISRTCTQTQSKLFRRRVNLCGSLSIDPKWDRSS